MTKQINNDISIKKQINFLCQHKSGDTMLACGYRDEIEKTYNCNLHFIIKPEHEFILKLYGYTDYTIKNYDRSTLLEISKEESDDNFIAHPECLNDEWSLLNKYYHYDFSFKELFQKTFGLPNDAIFKKPQNIPQVSKELENKIHHLLPFDNIVLFVPEAFSTPLVNKEFFEHFANTLQQQGYVGISSVIDPKNAIKGTEFISLSLEETLAIAIRCKKVYCTRSGFSDLLAQYTDDMTVFYPDAKTYELCNLNKTFNLHSKEVLAANDYTSYVYNIKPCCKLLDKITKMDGSEYRLQLSFNLFRKKVWEHKIKYYFLFIPILKIKFNNNKTIKRYYLFSLFQIRKVLL